MMVRIDMMMRIRQAWCAYMMVYRQTWCAYMMVRIHMMVCIQMMARIHRHGAHTDMVWVTHK